MVRRACDESDDEDLNLRVGFRQKRKLRRTNVYHRTAHGLNNQQVRAVRSMFNNAMDVFNCAGVMILHFLVHGMFSRNHCCHHGYR